MSLKYVEEDVQDGWEEVALIISLRCCDWETMRRENVLLNKYGRGKIEVFISGLTEFGTWEMKQMYLRTIQNPEVER